MRAGIPLTTLSKTFQDAIAITRSLCLDYIWIDSLCIIQDDHTDWEIEAAKMGSVYQNAFLTIAATRSADGRGGCFSAASDTPYIWQPRNDRTDDASTTQSASPILVQQERLWESVRFGSRSRGFTRWMTLRPSYDVRYLSRKGASKGIIDIGFPLFTRAWFLQERLLSPRVLHFGHMELFWECRCALWRECLGPEPLVPFEVEERDEDEIGEAFSWGGPVTRQDFEEASSYKQTQPERRPKKAIQYPIEKSRRVFTSLLNETSTHENSNQTQTDDTDIDVHTAWNMLIEEYTRLDLTRETDRLPALSGIAASRSESQYLAGIWADHLPASLYWTTEPSTLSPARRPHSYRAPSFSWASVEGPIKYRKQLSTKRETWDIIPSSIGYVVATVQNFSSTVEGLDPRGCVKAGHVEIEGYTGAATIVQLYQEKCATVCELQQGHRRQKFYLDIPLCLCRSEPAEIRPDDSVLLLLLECENLPPSTYQHCYRVMVLVLKPSAAIAGAYERIGLICPADDTVLYFSNYASGASDIGQSTSMFDEALKWFGKKQVVRIV